jgi:hypothetical protein
MGAHLVFQKISSDEARKFVVDSDAFIAYFNAPRDEEYSTSALLYSPVVIAEIFADYYDVRKTIISKGHAIEGTWENGLSGRLSLLSPSETKAFSDLFTPLNPPEVANSNADRYELAINSIERKDYSEHCIEVITEMQEFFKAAVASNQAIIIYFGH